MASKQVLKYTKSSKKGKTFYGKGTSGTLKRLSAQIKQVRKEVTKAVEWKRQYFFGNMVNGATGTLYQEGFAVSVKPFFFNITNWLFSQGINQGTPAVTSAAFPTGDGMSGTTITPRYMEIGYTLYASTEKNLSVDQMQPLLPFRVVIWQIKGNDYSEDSNTLTFQGAHIRLFDKSQLQHTIDASGSYLADPINASLGREFGGRSKPMHVLFDEIIVPAVPPTGSATTINSQYCGKIKIDLSKCTKVQFAEIPGTNWQSNPFFGNQPSYETGAIYMAVFNNWDNTQVQEPIGYNIQNMTFNGMLVYTDG